MHLQPNTLFANRYELIKLLGRGGFSEVWLAKDQWTHLKIALKVYAPGQGMDANGLQEFCGELASVYDLNHSNLLKPQHVDTWENMPYLIMAFCSEGSCAKKLGQMSEDAMWKFIHDVASGLAYLHSKDVVHQDIKPDNILIDDSGNYLITDFGVSTRARSTLRKSVVSSTAGGTTAYMGPERFSRQPAPTKASDIWSFGAMCFELLEGEVPFGEIGGGLQKGGAEIPTIQANVSDALKFTITKMLQKETWDRPIAETLVDWANNPCAINVDYSLFDNDSKPTEDKSQPSIQPLKEDKRATQRFSEETQIQMPTREGKSQSPIIASSQSDTTPKPSKKKKRWWIWLLCIFGVLGVVIIFPKIANTIVVNSEQDENEVPQNSSQKKELWYKEKGEQFLRQNALKQGVHVTKSGLQYVVLKNGYGAKPSNKDRVRVHYEGTLIDGTVFDSSIERGEPIEFALDQVIAGFAEGLQLMPAGSKFKLFIPQELGYGDRDLSSYGIPPYSCLIYEVELLGIEKTTNDIDAVDLGLSVKWASCNIGATKPEEIGDYIAYGEVETKEQFSWANYKFKVHKQSKYVNDTYTYYEPVTQGSVYLPDNFYGSEYDVATLRLGSGWRLPTSSEMKELENKCKWQWSHIGDVYGVTVTGLNGHWIFIPAGGYKDGTRTVQYGEYGYFPVGQFWGTDENEPIIAWFSANGRLFSDYPAYRGWTVRAVYTY